VKKNNWMNTLFALGIMVFFSSFSAASDEFFYPSMGDLREDASYAQQEGKKAIMLFFEMDECPFCKRMKREIFTQPEVMAYFGEHFLVIPIDIEGDTELTDFSGQTMRSKEFAQQIRVRATPVILFFDLTGKPLYRHTGPTKNTQEFLWLGEFIANGAYTDYKQFSAYRRHKAQPQ